jgi:hypothetical protein
MLRSTTRRNEPANRYAQPCKTRRFVTTLHPAAASSIGAGVCIAATTDPCPTIARIAAHTAPASNAYAHRGSTRSTHSTGATCATHTHTHGRAMIVKTIGLDDAFIGALNDFDRAFGTPDHHREIVDAIPQRKPIIAFTRAADELHVLAPLPINARIGMVAGAAVIQVLDAGSW